jgi:hypothetical protein
LSQGGGGACGGDSSTFQCARERAFDFGAAPSAVLGLRRRLVAYSGHCGYASTLGFSLKCIGTCRPACGVVATVRHCRAERDRARDSHAAADLRVTQRGRGAHVP